MKVQRKGRGNKKSTTPDESLLVGCDGSIIHINVETQKLLVNKWQPNLLWIQQIKLEDWTPWMVRQAWGQRAVSKSSRKERGDYSLME